MKVTLLGTLPPLRAISPYCLELVRHLDSLVDLDVLTFRHLYPRVLYPGGDLNDTTLRIEGVHTFTVRSSLDWYNPLGWWLSARRTRADVLHVQHWSAPLAPCLEGIMRTTGRQGTRCVLTLHNVIAHEPSRWYVPLTRRLCRLADRCIVHSESNRQDACNVLGVREDDIEVIPHGTQTTYLRDRLNGNVARQRLGLAAGTPVVLFFGAIRPYKGLDVLMRAFALALKRMPALRLIVAGQPWEPWKPYATIIRELGIEEALIRRLHFIPASEVHVLFHACDLVVLPYLHFAAQSGAGLTAIAFEKPLLVTRVGGLPDLQPEPSFVVDPGEEDALAAAMLRFYSDNALRTSLEGLARESAARFGWRQIAVRTHDTYERVCARPQGFCL